MNNDFKMFRNALGGFNKDDVVNYIKEADMKHSDEIAELKEQISSALSELEGYKADAEINDNALKAALNEADALRGKLTEAEAEINTACAKASELESELKVAKEAADTVKAQLELSLNELRAENDNLRCESEKAKNDNQRLSDELENAKAEIAKLTERGDRITAERDALLAEAVRKNEPEENPENGTAYKIEMYDRISSQIGDIIINTNRSADDIINAAREEAEQLQLDAQLECEQKRADCNEEIARIKSETEEEAAYIRERLSTAANSLLSEVSADLHGNIESCIREIATCISDVQYEFKTLLTKVESRSAEMNERVGYYHSCVTDGIDDKLREMDVKYGIKKPEPDTESGIS